MKRNASVITIYLNIQFWNIDVTIDNSVVQEDNYSIFWLDIQYDEILGCLVGEYHEFLQIYCYVITKIIYVIVKDNLHGLNEQVKAN